MADACNSTTTAGVHTITRDFNPLANATGLTGFAARVQAWHRRYDEVCAAYANTTVLLAKLGDWPEAPECLSETITAIDGTPDSKKGPWEASSLRWILDNKGLFYCINRSESIDGYSRSIIETGVRPLSAEALARVAELLAIREDYDRKREAFMAQVEAIEDVANGLNNRAWDDAVILIEKPSTCLADIALKVGIANRLEMLFSRGDAIDTTIETVFAEVERLAAELA